MAPAPGAPTTPACAASCRCQCWPAYAPKARTPPVSVLVEPDHHPGIWMVLDHSGIWHVVRTQTARSRRIFLARISLLSRCHGNRLGQPGLWLVKGVVSCSVTQEHTTGLFQHSDQIRAFQATTSSPTLRIHGRSCLANSWKRSNSWSVRSSRSSPCVQWSG